MKIYTKTGDGGMTSLYDGTRVQKSHEIFDLLGEIDELSSRIGMLCALNRSNEHSDQRLSNTSQLLRTIQHILQNFNSHLATPDESKKSRLPVLSETWVTKLEDAIDSMEKENSKLTKFILPGVRPIDAQAHLCRTQTRTVERMLVEKYNNCDVNLIMLHFFNRLSDYFFVLARWFCTINHIPDIIDTYTA
jgi:cob(I)alamin adenosyltransferase